MAAQWPPQLPAFSLRRTDCLSLSLSQCPLVPLFIALGCSQMLLEVGASFSPDYIAFGSFLKNLFLLGDLLGSSSSSGFDASAVFFSLLFRNSLKHVCPPKCFTHNQHCALFWWKNQFILVKVFDRRDRAHNGKWNFCRPSCLYRFSFFYVVNLLICLQKT